MWLASSNGEDDRLSIGESGFDSPREQINDEVGTMNDEKYRRIYSSFIVHRSYFIVLQTHAVQGSNLPLPGLEPGVPPSEPTARMRVCLLR